MASNSDGDGFSYQRSHHGGTVSWTVAFTVLFLCSNWALKKHIMIEKVTHEFLSRVEETGASLLFAAGENNGAIARG